MAASKIMTLQEMVALVPDGASLALGGSFLHRGPFAFVRELIRQGKKDLEIIKQSPGYDIDILCRAGCVKKARAGIVAMEGNFGLAPWYRRAPRPDPSQASGASSKATVSPAEEFAATVRRAFQKT